MNQDRTKRKLTAILSADVAGYSRLMEVDEVWTVKNLEENKRLISEFIEEHCGRVVDAPGDNMLAEFVSVLNAVECAVKIQKELKSRNANLIEERRMVYRIGVNLGDVIEEDGRIYGNGVNVAARIEGLAEPGGICISRTAYDQVATKLNLGYEFLGEFTVKNITMLVRVYRVLMDSKTAGKVTGEKKAPSRASYRTAVAAVIILIIIGAGLAGWIIYYHQSPKIESASMEPEKSSIVSEEKEAPKTIAVLPFENLSSEKDQEYFADGISEELLNSLTRISGLEVRGHTSSFYFKGKNEDLHTISKMLNVEYVLEGSVRKTGNQVRITVQLINIRKDAYIWSKTYERAISNIFAIQDDIAKSVADALQITLRVGELGRAPGMTSNINAYDAYLAGRSLRLKAGREYISQAIEKLKQAVALDPDFAIGWNELTNAYTNAAALLIPERGEEWTVKQKEAISRYNELFLKRFPESGTALIIAAGLSGDRIEIERSYNKALAVAPENYDTNYGYGWFLNHVGRPTEAIDCLKLCVRLEPLSALAHFELGATYELSGNLDAAATEYKKGKDLTSDPTIFNISLMVLAMEENNRALIDEYLALLYPDSQDSISKLNTRDLNQVMKTLLDKPGEAVAELRVFLNDPAYKTPNRRYPIAIWASYFGEDELALQIYRELGSAYSYLVWRPIHKGMRQLPGFKEYVKEIGLVDYWRKSGNWGDFCHPVGDDDFECN